MVSVYKEINYTIRHSLTENQPHRGVHVQGINGMLNISDQVSMP